MVGPVANFFAIASTSGTSCSSATHFQISPQSAAVSAASFSPSSSSPAVQRQSRDMVTDVQGQELVAHGNQSRG